MCRTTNPGGGGSSPPVRANHRLRRNRGGDGACAEGHGYFVSRDDDPAPCPLLARHRNRSRRWRARLLLPSTENGLWPSHRSRFLLGSACAVVTSFAHREAHHRGALSTRRHGGTCAEEDGYFACKARDRWFESNPADQPAGSS